MEQVRENVLDKVPYRRLKGRTMDGNVRIVMPKFSKPWKERMARAFGLPLEVTVNLDRRSSAAWRLIDGKRTVREIGVSMREEFGARIEPLYPRLAHLLRIMEINGLIGYRRPRVRRGRKARRVADRGSLADEGDAENEEGEDAVGDAD